MVQKQELLLSRVGLSPDQGSGSSSTDAIADLVNSNTGDEMIIQPNSIVTPAVGVGVGDGGAAVTRAQSMSGLDVWGEMALGDGGTSNPNMNSYQSASSQNQARPTTAQGFSFTQPDAMPPR